VGGGENTQIPRRRPTKCAPPLSCQPQQHSLLPPSHPWPRPSLRAGATAIPITIPATRRPSTAASQAGIVVMSSDRKGKDHKGKDHKGKDHKGRDHDTSHCRDGFVYVKGKYEGNGKCLPGHYERASNW
jgi:hypothetical protein